MWVWNPNPHSFWVGLLPYTRIADMQHCSLLWKLDVLGHLFRDMWGRDAAAHTFWCKLLLDFRRPELQYGAMLWKLVGLGNLLCHMRRRDATTHTLWVRLFLDFRRSELWFNNVPYNGHSYLDYHNVPWHLHYNKLNDHNIIGYNLFRPSLDKRSWRDSCGGQ